MGMGSDRMKEQTLYLIEVDSNHSVESFPVKVYLDEYSAEIGIREHFNDYWIRADWVRIKEIKAVSYKQNK